VRKIFWRWGEEFVMEKLFKVNLLVEIFFLLGEVYVEFVVGKIYYLSYSENDRHFHLEGIVKEKSISRTFPCRIDTKFVYTTIIDTIRFDDLGNIVFSIFPCPVRSAKINRNRETFIVEETSVHGEETHEN
jgi:hypothetical protein